jgi:acyl-CoA dehydrogenase
MSTETARDDMTHWQRELSNNCYTSNTDIQHTVSYLFTDDNQFQQALINFGRAVTEELIPAVKRNDERLNLPQAELYDGIGQRIDKIDHSPWYSIAGDIIYGSKLMRVGSTPGHLTKALLFFFLSSHAGEAGHNCPIACSAGLIRVLQRCPTLQHQAEYIEKLTAPSFKHNHTAAQFITELQGGSDVGANQVMATANDDGTYSITGEKWFCSNANAELILMTARCNDSSGTAGLGLFLVPTTLDNGTHNHFNIRRLKEKIGTRALASAEIDFNQAIGYPITPLDSSFNILMVDVLHLSRLYNTFCVLGMGRRAYQIASGYAKHRSAFKHKIISYPLVQANLTRIRCENTALMAAAVATARLQDKLDINSTPNTADKLLLRLLANLNKTVSARWTVDHIHHCIDVLAGNGAIESFSSLPRLLRDSLVCENWEGTHNTLYMQIARDIEKYQIDEIFTQHLASLIIDSREHKDAAVQLDILEKLQLEIDAFKADNSASQTLRLPSLIESMMIAYASFSLMHEAMHENKISESKTKYYQWQYFNELHQQKTSASLNTDLLSILS